jgi:hypothetical protein
MHIQDARGEELRVGDRVRVPDGRVGTVASNGDGLFHRVRVDWEPPDPKDGGYREWTTEPLALRCPDLIRIDSETKGKEKS